MCAVPRRTCRVRTEMVSNFFSTSNVKAVHFNGPLQDTQNGASTVPERYGTFPFTHWYITNLRCFEAKFWLVLKTKQHIFSCFWILLPNDLEKVTCSPPKNQLLARLHPNSRLWFTYPSGTAFHCSSSWSSCTATYLLIPSCISYHIAIYIQFYCIATIGSVIINHTIFVA